MDFGVSIFLFAIGAILAFAVNVSPQGFDLNVLGVILMLIGMIGFGVSLLAYRGYGPVTRLYGRERPAVYDDHGHADGRHLRTAGRRGRVVERRTTHVTDYDSPPL